MITCRCVDVGVCGYRQGFFYYEYDQCQIVTDAQWQTWLDYQELQQESVSDYVGRDPASIVMAYLQEIPPLDFFYPEMRWD